MTCHFIIFISDFLWNSTFDPGTKYFITVEACNEALLCRNISSDGIVLDDSPPVQGLVRIGSLSSHQTYIPRKYTKVCLFIPRHTIVALYYGFTLGVHVSVRTHK